MTAPRPSEPPAAVAAAIELIKRYAEGEAVDFSSVAVDLDGVDQFHRAIYQAARKLDFGQTTTYGGLAEAAGHPGKARETGEALGRNPVPLIVPCHRILAAGGKIGGFSAPGGSATKEKLLALEGVQVGPPPRGPKGFRVLEHHQRLPVSGGASRFTKSSSKSYRWHSRTGHDLVSAVGI